MNDYERMARVIRHLDESFHQQSSLEDLAAVAGLSPSYFQRLFSKLTGVTPKDFVQCLTAEHAKQMLREGPACSTAPSTPVFPARDAVHDLCVTLEAASPGEVKNGGHGLTIQATDLAPPLLGSACWLKRCAEFARCHLSIPLSADLLKNAFRPSGRAPGFPAPTRPRTVLQEILTAQLTALRPLRAFVKGSKFQIRVWRALLRIPPVPQSATVASPPRSEIPRPPARWEQR